VAHVERRDANRTVPRIAGAGARWAAALTAAGLALTGCGAGQQAQTSEMKPAITGVDVDAGDVALRDLQVDFGEEGRYPRGGAAPLLVWMSNEGEATVVLESVTSPDAEAVVLVAEGPVAGASESPSDGASASPDGDPAEPPGGEEPTDAGASATPSADLWETPGGFDESSTPEGQASPEATATPTGDASATASASATPTGEETTGAAPSGDRDFTIELGPSSHVRLTPSTGSFLMLEGLEEEVDMRSTVEVVFTFSNGESVTAHLPMGEPDTAPSRSYFEGPHDPHGE
jgi:hypothetical protein